MGASPSVCPHLSLSRSAGRAAKESWQGTRMPRANPCKRQPNCCLARQRRDSAGLERNPKQCVPVMKDSTRATRVLPSPGTHWPSQKPKNIHTDTLTHAYSSNNPHVRPPDPHLSAPRVPRACDGIHLSILSLRPLQCVQCPTPVALLATGGQDCVLRPSDVAEAQGPLPQTSNQVGFEHRTRKSEVSGHGNRRRGPVSFETLSILRT